MSSKEALDDFLENPSKEGWTRYRHWCLAEKQGTTKELRLMEKLVPPVPPEQAPIYSLSGSIPLNYYSPHPKSVLPLEAIAEAEAEWHNVEFDPKDLNKTFKRVFDAQEMEGTQCAPTNTRSSCSASKPESSPGGDAPTNT